MCLKECVLVCKRVCGSVYTHTLSFTHKHTHSCINTLTLFHARSHTLLYTLSYRQGTPAPLPRALCVLGLTVWGQVSGWRSGDCVRVRVGTFFRGRGRQGAGSHFEPRRHKSLNSQPSAPTNRCNPYVYTCTHPLSLTDTNTHLYRHSHTLLYTHSESFAYTITLCI